MGRHAGKTFNHLQLSRKKEPGLYNAGPGLFLCVTLRRRLGRGFAGTCWTGERGMGLGSYPEISLADARTAARRPPAKGQGNNPIQRA